VVGGHDPAVTYAFAVLAAVAGTAFRLSLDPVLGTQFPFAPLLVAVLWASARGGAGPGLVAALVGAAAGARFLVAPRGSFDLERVDHQAEMGLYLGVSCAIVSLGTVMRTTRLCAEELAARALKDAEQLRVTLASIGDGVIVTDHRGHVASMNPVAETLTGAKAAQAEGQAHGEVFKIVDEGTRERVKSPVEKVLSGGRESGPANHTILVAPDGQERVIDHCASPIRGKSGEVLGVVLVFREIGDRRRSDETQRRLASILENSEDAIIGKSLDGTITSWNAGAERLYGYSAPEVIGKPSAFLTPGDRDSERSTILAGLKQKGKVQSFETVRRAKDGRLIDVSLSMAPIRDATGRIIGSSTIARDITPQRRAAEEIRKAEEALREADRNKNAFLAVLSHELRNPLAPLLHALTILKRPDADGATLVEARDMAERQVHHLARLVDDLLDVSRITHGKIELRQELVELSTAVARAVETAVPAIEGQRHEFSVTLPHEPVWLHADLMRIAQVLANLLNNSAKYTTPGGKISLEAEAVGGEAVIRVRDTGIGIPEAALPRVFDMFAQAAPADSRSPTSLGVGLRLVKSLVQLHGGSVSASSPGLGRGSEFVVRLPTVAAPLHRAVEGAQEAPPSRPRQVLVVDDNADAASSLAILLRLEGHRADVAHSGPEALEAVARSRPDVVFLDIGMPGMDGYEVARRLRARHDPVAMKLVALTGWGQEHDRRLAQAAGFDDHLTKPVAATDLQALLAADPRP
jgi:PAS domain S-box-containing protein